MSEQDEMFPEIVSKVPVEKPVACKFPYFIVAYWPRGRWWSIDSQMYSGPDGDEITKEVKLKQSSGWTHVTIMRLPASLCEEA